MSRSEITEAEKHFRDLEEMAQAGNANAQDRLAFEFQRKFNHTKAAYWYKEAAKQGHSGAQDSLAFYYLQNGSEKDAAEAISWYRKAADPHNIRANLPMAQTNLGNCLYKGIGCKKNSSEAILWLCRAVTRNDADAKEKLQEWSFTGRYNVEFRKSDKHNTTLTKDQIIEVINGMKSVGRTKTNASTIIGNLVNFSVVRKTIKTEKELNEILEALKENNPALIPEKSKSYLMIDEGCREILRLRVSATVAPTTVTRTPETEVGGTGIVPSASARRSSAAKVATSEIAAVRSSTN